MNGESNTELILKTIFLDKKGVGLIYRVNYTANNKGVRSHFLSFSFPFPVLHAKIVFAPQHFKVSIAEIEYNHVTLTIQDLNHQGNYYFDLKVLTSLRNYLKQKGDAFILVVSGDSLKSLKMKEFRLLRASTMLLPTSNKKNNDFFIKAKRIEIGNEKPSKQVLIRETITFKASNKKIKELSFSFLLFHSNNHQSGKILHHNFPRFETVRDENGNMEAIVTLKGSEVWKKLSIDFLISRHTRSWIGAIPRDIIVSNYQNHNFPKEAISNVFPWDINKEMIQFLETKKFKEKSLDKTIEEIVVAVNTRLKYVANNQRFNASSAWNNQKGDCSEFSDVTAALLKRLGIPTRIAKGWVLKYESGAVQLSPHQWIEIYVPEKGWIPLDPTWKLIEGITWFHILRYYEEKEPKKYDLKYSLTETTPNPKNLSNNNGVVPKIHRKVFL